MSNRQISIRIGMEGGADVTRSIDEITRAGTDGFDRMAASWGKTGEAAEKYKAQLQQIAAAAKEAALADEVNQSWSKFLGISDQVTNSAREAAKALGEGRDSTISWSQALGTSTQVLGAFGVALSAAGFASWIEQLDHATATLDNQAKVLGISTDALQAYHAAAVFSGAGADAGDQAIQRFTRSLGDAQAGSKLQIDAFRQLGLEGIDLAGSTESVLPKVAEALLQIQDASQRARIETELFGRGGQQVEQVLREWADPELIDNIKKTGVVLDEAIIQRMANAQKAWDTFWLHVDAIASKGGLFPSVFADAGQILYGGQSPTKAPIDPLVAAAAAARVSNPTEGIGFQLDVAPMLPALAQAIEVAKSLEQFHDDVAKLIDEDPQAKKAAEDYQAILDRAGITNVPANYTPGGRTALEAALDGIGTGGVPISINRSTDLSLISTSGPKNLDQGVSGASRSQLIPDEAQYAADRLVEKIQEEARIAALLPEYRQSELEILNEQYRRHVELGDAQKEEIRNAEELKLRNEEIAQTIQSMQGDFANFLKTAETTGKLSFGSLFRSILSDWEDLLNKMIAQQAFQALFGGAGGGAGGLFNSLDLAVGGPGLGGGGAGLLSDVFASVFHSGGVAGDVAPSRRVPASFFNGAPRYHSGIDEVPAILQPGERVLTRAQNANYNPNGSRKVEITVKVDVTGARGSQEIADAVSQGVAQGLASYDQSLDRRIAPTVRRLNRDPRFMY